MTVTTTTSNCRTNKCTNQAADAGGLCRVCTDDAADRRAPMAWNGRERVSESIPRRAFALVCIACGRTACELMLTPAQERYLAVIGHLDGVPSGCAVCGGFLLLEARVLVGAN